ncbi:MAG TPA: hypothetical protein VGR28_03380, partial [Candidatus Thermoplasmatota archaeon]|nr:hypothetical protein [Candidatus Thermoplasmatota archaeon]
RISVTVDNTAPDGKKLFPEVRGDQIVVSRVLKRSGDYHYYLNDKPVQKQEVAAAFHRVGLNPDNLMIVMHQMMVARFAAVSPQEKLRMLEEALGFQSYRGEVLDALSRLRKASDEERTLKQLLDSSRETFEYWQREYERWQRKEELERRVHGLEAEQAWAGVARREAALEKLDERIRKAQAEVAAIEAQLESVDEARSKAERSLADGLTKLRALRAEVLKLNRDEERLNADLAWAKRVAPKAPDLAAEVEALAGEATAKVKDVRARLAERGVLLEQLEVQVEDDRERAIEGRVDGEVMRFKRTLLIEEAQRLDGEAKQDKEDLEALIAAALKLGARVQPRKSGEVAAEMTQVKEQLKPLAHLSDEVVKVYEQHQRSFEGIREKSDVLARNKEALRTDLDARIGRWREVLAEELASISDDYQGLLKVAGATGRARLVNAADIERAGLEIEAGFKGQEPIALETFAQSGGERSVALMAFLLALQQRIASPFRAVDEFDVHMDPRNRELITGMIVQSAAALEAKGVQYLAITPAALAPPDGVAVIVVQNAGAGSRVGRLAVA